MRLLSLVSVAVILVEQGLVNGLSLPLRTGSPACFADGYTAQTKCICNLNDGSGLVDLTTLVKLTAANPLSGATLKYNYYLVLCGVITNMPNRPSCNDISASCEYSVNTAQGNDIGIPSTTRFEYRVDDDGQSMLSLVMDAGASQPKRTVVYLHCDPTVTGAPTFKAYGRSSTPDGDGYGVYTADLSSAYICPTALPPSSLSAGSIMLIIFFTMLTVYFVGGVLFLTFYAKKEGKERIPNVGFWSELPHWIKDGIMFSYTAIRQCVSKSKGEYQSY